jgi:hypothetical protein
VIDESVINGDNKPYVMYEREKKQLAASARE